jgi:DivIVA domain-containing protein
MFETMVSVNPFPLTSKSTHGYDVDAVDAFLAQARAAYDADSSTAVLTSSSVRQVSFPMKRGGYEVAPVDDALERLEVAMAERERERAIEREGWEGFTKRTHEGATEIVARLSRPARKRFRRTALLTAGYRVSAVDDLSNIILSYLESGAPLNADQVRNAVFPSQRGGYDEQQVDVVLDAVIDVILASGRR